MQKEEQILITEFFDKALMYVNKILPFLPDFSHFNTSAIVLNSSWSQQEIDEAYKLNTFIETLLVDRLKYANEQNGPIWLELNELGRQVKNAGGHFAYLKKMQTKL